MQKEIQILVDESLKIGQEFFSSSKTLDLMNQSIKQLVFSFDNSGTAISCGNGGSMCDAIHFAEELTGRFIKERAPLPAVSISDSGHISCVANDYGYENIFSRYIEAFGKKNDTLLAISTSGNSKNVINACKIAKSKKIKIIGLLGKDGGVLKNFVDIPIIVPSKKTERIQETHIKIIHLFIKGVEKQLFPGLYS